MTEIKCGTLVRTNKNGPVYFLTRVDRFGNVFGRLVENAIERDVFLGHREDVTPLNPTDRKLNQ